jgi:ribosome-associated protein
MENDLVINPHLIIPGSELIVSVSRASGPGGQHVNKTSSRVSLRWSIRNSNALTDEEKALIIVRLKSRLVGEDELLIHVESERSQYKNRQIAKERLIKLVREALRPKKPRVATKPSTSAKNKRITNKKRHGTLKKLRKLIERD